MKAIPLNIVPQILVPSDTSRVWGLTSTFQTCPTSRARSSDHPFRPFLPLQRRPRPLFRHPVRMRPTSPLHCLLFQRHLLPHLNPHGIPLSLPLSLPLRISGKRRNDVPLGLPVVSRLHPCHLHLLSPRPTTMQPILSADVRHQLRRYWINRRVSNTF